MASIGLCGHPQTFFKIRHAAIAFRAVAVVTQELQVINVASPVFRLRNDMIYSKITYEEFSSPTAPHTTSILLSVYR